jgi:glycosyltransferase involved in cell wall biosynthesis
VVSVTIAIATYNDEGSIEKVLLELDNLLFQMSSVFTFEILFVDDGSSDQSIKILEKYQLGKNNVKIHKNQINLGFGKTFKLLFTLPKSEWVFFNTGDNQFPMSNFEILLKEMDKADIIVGIRKLRKDNWKRRLNSRVYNWSINLFLNQKVSDVNSILLFKRMILDKIDLKGNSAFINAELILKADRQNIKIKTCQIEHRERNHGVGSGGKWHVIYPTIFDFLNYIVRRK